METVMCSLFKSVTVNLSRTSDFLPDVDNGTDIDVKTPVPISYIILKSTFILVN